MDGVDCLLFCLFEMFYRCVSLFDMLFQHSIIRHDDGPETNCIMESLGFEIRFRSPVVELKYLSIAVRSFLLQEYHIPDGEHDFLMLTKLVLSWRDP